jgi:hypothetical protein
MKSNALALLSPKRNIKGSRKNNQQAHPKNNIKNNEK